MPGFAVLPGGQVTASVKGSYYLNTEAAFRSDLQNYIVMQGFRVLSLDLKTSGYVTVDYTATIVVSPQASTTTDRIVDAVRTAAENAGGATPTVTIAAAGEAAQADPDAGVLGGLANTITKTVSDALTGVGGIAEGAGKAATNVADLTKDLKTVLIVAAVGLVVIVGFLALGPNLRGVGRNVRVG